MCWKAGRVAAGGELLQEEQGEDVAGSPSKLLGGVGRMEEGGDVPVITSPPTAWKEGPLPSSLSQGTEEEELTKRGVCLIQNEGLSSPGGSLEEYDPSIEAWVITQQQKTSPCSAIPALSPISECESVTEASTTLLDTPESSRSDVKVDPKEMVQVEEEVKQVEDNFAASSSGTASHESASIDSTGAVYGGSTGSLGREYVESFLPMASVSSLSMANVSDLLDISHCPQQTVLGLEEVKWGRRETVAAADISNMAAGGRRQSMLTLSAVSMLPGEGVVTLPGGVAKVLAAPPMPAHQEEDSA